MNHNYRQLTENIRSRINPENIILSKTYRDDLSGISYSDALVFIRTAMKAVEPEYTLKSKQAGERVKDHLSDLQRVSFEYQGSVMTNTHIKGYSDIDLLTISDKFYQPDRIGINQLLESSEQVTRLSTSSISKLKNEISAPFYQGNAEDDLRALRMECENTLETVYSVCDKTKPKSIKIKNLNLNRDVDIVIANWYDDITSIINDKQMYRGIQVYNKETHSRGKADFPFLSIKRINERGDETNGRIKKMIRFIKNIKSLSTKNIELSSFDINAICYDISVDKYRYSTYLQLVPILYHQIKSLCEDKNHSDNLVSVDGRERIFRNNNAKLENLKLVLTEFISLIADMPANSLS
ncbi:hypothetical protein BDE36_0196 [Arcticibacter tournemirensis]|uniref:cGAS/DncV-like nucleotidyltransferase C-terminal helical domain-containing protein n=1 Tax=Arcticibacter tournemirensis TaxID=699437 RepID=A0A5M9GJT0_9SPHI|nr:hypothetical protein [Arcticibacter tournemirensis]KAA8474031.1 hypothetical protein F1649_22415 [Arcticibacter tournemirensis]TQM48512.1 hypothetical protein BDE36_0196 [Arcticibacter tournemirensis]